MNPTRCPPLAWLALSLLLVALAARAEPSAWTLGPLRWLGWPLLACGVALCAAALAAMRRHGTTSLPGQEAAALVADGVFGWSRNPIYLGFGLVAAGLACLLDTALGLLAAPLLLLVIDRAFVRREEAALARAFGPAFDAYRARTRRWL